MVNYFSRHKRIILAALFIMLVIVINSLCNYLLIQPGLSRTMFYEAKKQDYQCMVLGASHGSYGIDPVTLEEETGYVASDMKLLVSVRTTVAFCNEKIDIYLATGLKRTAQHLDEDEFVNYFEMPINEVIEGMGTDQFPHALMGTALAMYLKKVVSL